ncbi:MAG TPA: CBS domain-containing protein [Holophagaceae bacterium]|nr:CBS domain-containing protein [Holophagaceae bacterium]
MIVRDLCTCKVTTCHLDTNLAEVAERLGAQDCGALPVLDDAEKVVGVITDRDVAMALAARKEKAARLPARDVMTAPAHCVHPDDSVALAMRYMRQYQVRRIPVVDGLGKVQGLLSMNDLILHAQEDLPGSPPSLPYSEVMETLKVLNTHPVARLKRKPTLVHA